MLTDGDGAGCGPSDPPTPGATLTPDRKTFMILTDSPRGRFALVVTYCAGTIDMVALPVWIGTLVGRYRLDPQQAGLLVTLFLMGVVLASVTLAPRFHRLNPRWVTSAGFAFAIPSLVATSHTDQYTAMATLHALAGFGVGMSISTVYGTIARSANPHRMFGLVTTALSLFAVAFLGVLPPWLAQAPRGAVFEVFAAVMAVGLAAALWSFPMPPSAQTASHGEAPQRPPARFSSRVWLGLLGIGAMTLVQAMCFSFLERAGIDRGFSIAAVTSVLVAVGIVNIFPAALAALLEKRVRTRLVLLFGPPLQALMVVGVMTATSFWPYAVAASSFVAVMLFTTTFAFGLIARIEPSGRALAAAPAVMMTGSAIGPILAGTLIQASGYGSVGIAACVVDVIAIVGFFGLYRGIPAGPSMREQVAA